MAALTEKQRRFLLGIVRAHYPTMSASEGGDPELMALIDQGYVDTYWGVGGTHMELTEAGEQKLTAKVD